MGKILSFLFILISFSSCSNHENLLYIDSYYNKLYDLDKETHSYQTVIYDKNDVNLDLFDNYKRIVISPLVYYNLKEFWFGYPGDLFILEGNGVNLPLNHKNVFVNDTHAYSQLRNSLFSDKRSKDVKEIGLIADYITPRDKSEMDSLVLSLTDDYKVSLCYLDKTSSKNKLDKFIKDGEIIDLWIIDSKTNGLHAFDLLGDNNLLIIKDGAILRDLNHNIMYSVDLHLNKQIGDIFKHDLDVIYSELKKY
ncbi:MAG: hypothetical protein B6229_00085 [Spirochaetaceae bacterium 4572_7]|nr:MAG: hypothetical protein B6229_00085 [Spirochaetaceae bacterium 4572_7]